MSDKVRHKAICMTCGARDRETNPNGLCHKNDHDNWLEERDVEEMNIFFKRFAKRCELSYEQLEKMFMDPRVLTIKIIHK